MKNIVTVEYAKGRSSASDEDHNDKKMVEKTNVKIEEFGSRDTLIDKVKRRRRKKIQHILIERREVDQLSCNRGRV